MEEKKFTNKYDLLPEEAKLYYSSDISGDAIVKLVKDYKLEEDKVYALVFLLVNSEFDLELIKNKIKSLNLTGISAKNFYTDFLGYLVFPIEVYIEKKLIKKNEISEELIRLKVNKSKYLSTKDKLQDLIEDKNMEALENAISDFEKTVDPKEERDYVIDILKNNLLEILQTDSLNANLSLNRGFIYLLFNVEGFKSDAISIIKNSQSLIGKENIKLDDREVAPSVSNWIRSFIKEEGADLFDDLTLAKYLDRSSNAKKLNSDEKKLLSSLLIFFKNINYFPESMRNTLPENWQIFPFEVEQEEFEDVLNDEKENNKEVKNHIEKESVESESTKKLSEEIEEVNEILEKKEEVIKKPKIKKEEPLKADQKILEKNNKKPVEKKEELNLNNNIDKREENIDRENIINLKNELLKYPPLSLEYKALSSEIKRLEKKIDNSN